MTQDELQRDLKTKKGISKVSENITEVQKLLKSFIDCGKVKRVASLPINQVVNTEISATARYKQMIQADPYLRQDSPKQ